MDSVFPPLTERQERLLKRMELLRELRKPSPWYWMRLVFCRPLHIRWRWPAPLWFRAALTLGWGVFLFWVNRSSSHPRSVPTVWMIFMGVPLLIALFDRYVMAPAERKIAVAIELLEQEQEKEP
jgi:hypothetical protein